MPPTRLLWPYERPARSPLAPWADALTPRLTRFESPAEVAAYLNQAALVFSHLGFADVARWVCHEHIDLVAREARSDRTLVGLAFQPSINLGRLDVLHGDHAAGRERFRLAEFMATTQPVVLGERCRVEGGDWELLARAYPTLESTLSNVHLVDSLQSWLAECSFDEALAFAETASRRPSSGPQPALQEARVACRVGLGDLAQAATDARRVPPHDEWSGIAVALHLARGYWDAGDIGVARQLTLESASYLTDVGWDRVDPGQMARFLPMMETTVGLARTQGLSAVAARLAGVLLAVATRAADQVGAINALQTLRALGQEPCLEESPTMAWTPEGCDYFVIRSRHEVLPLQPTTERMRPFEDLLEAVARATGARHRPDLFARAQGP